jgi:hypothetical protein
LPFGLTEPGACGAPLPWQSCPVQLGGAVAPSVAVPRPAPPEAVVVERELVVDELDDVARPAPPEGAVLVPVLAPLVGWVAVVGGALVAVVGGVVGWLAVVVTVSVVVAGPVALVEPPEPEPPQADTPTPSARAPNSETSTVQQRRRIGGREREARVTAGPRAPRARV